MIYNLRFIYRKTLWSFRINYSSASQCYVISCFFEIALSVQPWKNMAVNWNFSAAFALFKSAKLMAKARKRVGGKWPFHKIRFSWNMAGKWWVANQSITVLYLIWNFSSFSYCSVLIGICNQYSHVQIFVRGNGFCFYVCTQDCEIGL